jgi:glycosyltransferase involved in cell wall biosynthesis
MSEFDSRRIHVGYDREAFCSQTIGGVSRYFSSIMDAFLDRPELGIDVDVLFSRSINEHLSLNLCRRIEPRTSRELLLLSVRGMNRFGNQGLRNRLLAAIGGPIGASHELDIIHVTGFSPQPRDLVPGVPVAVTIQDLIPQLMPEYWKGWNPQQGRDTVIKSASIIFVPSEVTKSNLLQVEGKLKCEVRVVSHGVDLDVFTVEKGSQDPQIVDFPYVLFVGRRSRYKRFDLLLRAVSQVRSRGLDIGLVIAGGGRLSRGEKSAVLDVLPRERFLQLSPSDLELAALLRHAEGLCLPSEAEGFGLPILEAFACGCPCVLTDIPVFREVAGESALFFTLGDEDSLAENLMRVASDVQVQRNLANAGVEHAAGFGWQHAAEALASGYRSVL